ncbi:uncharacterized protein LOC113236088 [Hyposmocoma kahamanoa]|uniref:uncharacterized protein LOC113236088 n=1 Tax=Hyposmocoma kahamanoa TaxID=1477025 RepID=UPI000E6D663A|nr:uncharacterized protein LOC113236088 [Hyposmocoma kahamanoa]
MAPELLPSSWKFANVKPVPKKGSRADHVSSQITLESVKSLIQEASDDLLAKLEGKITKIVDTKTKEIFKEINELKVSLNYLNEEHEDLKKELKQKCNVVKELEDENMQIKMRLTDINSRLNVMEQYSRTSNVEIQCIPEYKTENLEKIVGQISKVTGSEIQGSDIYKCTRIAKLNSDSKRPRSVVVKFSSPRIRDTFMAGVIKFNKNHASDKLSTSHIGIGGEKRAVYVVDHLTPEMKKLHAAARITGKRLGYQFVWVKNGRVFMRKSDTTEHVIVKSAAQLELLK